MSNNTPTPRTDAFFEAMLAGDECHADDILAFAKYARQLERELAASQDRERVLRERLTAIGELVSSSDDFSADDVMELVRGTLKVSISKGWVLEKAQLEEGCSIEAGSPPEPLIGDAALRCAKNILAEFVTTQPPTDFMESRVTNHISATLRAALAATKGTL